MGELRLMRIICAIAAGFVLDCIFGDPVYSFHPVRVMGNIILAGSRLKKKGQSKAAAFFAGAFLSVFLIGGAYAVSFALLFLLYKAHFALGLAAEIGLCYQILAAKALKDESMAVYRELSRNDIPKARLYLSYIVGRDTQDLNEEQISKAAVETIAENLSDGVIAPMMYMFIGGAPLGLAYKAVSTLDSMIGYNNEKYAWFGKFAARADDAANFIPSRIAALLVIFVSAACRRNARQALKIFLRDRYNHKSPNSAQTESAFAGALGVSLAGDAYYSGVLVKKPVIGDPLRAVTKEDIRLADRLMYLTAVTALFLGIMIRLVLYFYV